MKAQEWRARGQLRTVGKHRIFYVDTGGDDRPVLAILHGYPTSSFDYWRALPMLATRYRVIVHDHLGFGFSDKPHEYSYSLIEQADHALLLWRALGLGRVHLLAHDYGTSVATELVARRNQGVEPVALTTLTLCNGSMHIELSRRRPIQKMLAHPLLGPVVARLSSRGMLARNLRKTFANPSLLSGGEIDAIWEQMVDGRAVLPRVSRYQNERFLFWHRWIGALEDMTLPTSILWARQDPVAVEAIAHQLHKEIAGSRLRLLDGLGHFPMIEDAETWAGAVLELIGEMSRDDAVG